MRNRTKFWVFVWTVVGGSLGWFLFFSGIPRNIVLTAKVRDQDTDFLANAIGNRRYTDVAYYVKSKRPLGPIREDAYIEQTGSSLSDNGYRPLLTAIDCNRPDICHLLIKNGANVMTRGRWKSTALHRVAQTEMTQIALELIEKGADVNASDEFGRTPVDSFFGQNGYRSDETLKLLIEHGGLCKRPTNDSARHQLHLKSKADTLAYCLRWALSEDRYDLAEWLLKQGADPNRVFPERSDTVLVELMRASSSYRRTPLIQYVKLLLIYRANPNLLGPPIKPIERVEKDIVNGLVVGTTTHPASECIEAKSDGNAPLHLACLIHRTDIAQLLLEHGANPNAMNAAGKTPLDLVVPIEDVLR